MRRLIINADDFGLTGGVNRAIIECHRAGTVTSATLMANSKEFAAAVDRASAFPKLGVGCHIVLVDGEPLLPLAQVSSLLTPGSTTFRNSAAEYARAAVRQQLAPKEVAAEAAAQITRLQSAGIQVTHFDTHKHTHMFPTTLRALLGTARELGVRAVRNPFAPLHGIDRIEVTKHPKLWLRYIQMKMLSRYSAGFLRAVKDADLRTTDGTFGILETGTLDEKTFYAILDAIPDGTWEFVCHPGYNNAALAKVTTRLRDSRGIELQVLTAPGLPNELRRRGIELISFADI